MINENLAENYKLQGVYIELTSKCNLRCLHCYNESGSLRGMLGIAEFNNILDSLQEGEDTAVTLSGGEPLLHPSIWTFIEELDKKNFGKKLMITNATLITPQIAKQLKNHQISIQISLNGSCAETHDKLCGKGNFERTIRGINNLLQEEIQERILIRCMVSAFNLNDIEKMIDMLVQKGIRQIDLATLTLLGRGKENKAEMYLSPQQKKKFLKDINSNEHLKSLIESGLKISFPDEFTGVCPLILNEIDGGKIPLTPRIDSYGHVYLCQLFSGENYSIGNVYDNILTKICESDRLSHLVWFMRYGMKYMHECEKCVWQSACGKGCLALALSNGSIQETDGECELRREQLTEDFLQCQ
ncbi:radical SAM protein [Petralouisia muris]|uniref:Radical SAM protein n=3 Tax=Lachnospiraceae TaxID=186803 RepID=A0AC61RT08_9FIRM|nr:radical SAM protein [Petralouisia muris]TGY95051.1 radical SAM protein [Petralouisia muris]